VRTQPVYPASGALLMIIFKINCRAERGPTLLGRGPHPLPMATAKTGTFYLTETVTFPAASAAPLRVQGTIDLGAYVNVPTGQAIAVHSIDFIFQNGTGFSGNVEDFLVGSGSITTQLTSLNPGTALVRADNQSLIASSALCIDQPNNIASHVSDLFPDNFGPNKLSEAYLVVNDSMFLCAGINGSNSNAANDQFVTVRIRCSVVKLGSSDWMSIAIQQTANDA